MVQVTERVVAKEYHIIWKPYKFLSIIDNIFLHCIPVSNHSACLEALLALASCSRPFEALDNANNPVFVPILKHHIWKSDLELVVQDADSERRESSEGIGRSRESGSCNIGHFERSPARPHRSNTVCTSCRIETRGAATVMQQALFRFQIDTLSFRAVPSCDFSAGMVDSIGSWKTSGDRHPV